MRGVESDLRKLIGQPPRVARSLRTELYLLNFAEIIFYITVERHLADSTQGEVGLRPTAIFTSID